MTHEFIGDRETDRHARMARSCTTPVPPHTGPRGPAWQVYFTGAHSTIRSRLVLFAHSNDHHTQVDFEHFLRALRSL